MKKLLALGAIFGSLALLASVSQAAGTATFTVKSNLASACRVVTATDAQTITVPAYTAFQSTASVSPGNNIDFDCTRTLAGITANFDASAGSTSSTSGASPTGAGVLSNGLNYTLVATASTTAAGTAADETTIGTAQNRRFAVVATIPADQAGTCTTGTCANGTQPRTLTLNF